MPQEPKKRHSRQRKGKRRASIRLKNPGGVLCANCKTFILPHTVCKNCGYYEGKQIMKISKTIVKTKADLAREKAAEEKTS